MPATETQGDRRPVNEAGVYQLKETGAEIVTASGDKGRIQADAIVRQGWVRVGDIPSGTPKAETKTPEVLAKSK